MKLPLPDYNKPIKVGDVSFVYKGVYHPIYWLGEDPYRPRVETLVIRNGREIYLRMYDNKSDSDYRYRLPGGSLDNDSSKLAQAENEVNEEALLKVKDIYGSGIQYTDLFKDGKLLKGGDICIAYKGRISDVFVANYDGKMDKSKIEHHDLDDDMANHGKFYHITTVARDLNPKHIDAILGCPYVDDDVKFIIRLVQRGDVAGGTMSDAFNESPLDKLPTAIKEEVSVEELEPVPKNVRIFHGSRTQNIKELKAFNPDRMHSGLGPVIFATESEKFSAVYCCEWDDTKMFLEQNPYDDSLTVKVTDQLLTNNWNNPCSIYEVENDGFFKRLPGCPNEVITTGPVKVISETKYNSAYDAYEKYGIKVTYPGLVSEAIVTEALQKGMKPIFLIGIKYNSPFGNTIRTISGGNFNHAAIALEPDLKEMYSYVRKLNGIKSDDRKNGFDIETLKYFVEKDENAFMIVNAMFIKKEYYDDLKHRIQDYVHKSSKETKYDYMNLLRIALGVSIDDKKVSDTDLICSEFVAKMLSTVAKVKLPKPANLMTPQDIASMDNYNENIITVYYGPAKDYKVAKTNKLLSELTATMEATDMDRVKAFMYRNYTPCTTDVCETKRSELSDDQFGIPSLRKYELDTKKHTLSAIKLFNWVDPKYEKELAENIIKKIKEFEIDDSDIHMTEKNRFSNYYKKGGNYNG